MGDYLPRCSAAHLAAALSRLGGFATADPPSQEDLQALYWTAATTWVQRLTTLSEDATVLDWARWGWAEGRDGGQEGVGEKGT